MTMLPVRKRLGVRRTMGITTARVVIRNLADREQSVEVDLTVDTGAIYSVVPASVLASIGIQPEERRRTFDLADGRTVRRDVGWAVFELQGQRAPSRVIFGVRGDAGLLGMVTLEELALSVDPRKRSLRPLRLMIA